jgi:hypothetical protein
MKEHIQYLNKATLGGILFGRYSIQFLFDLPTANISLENDVYIDGVLEWRYNDPIQKPNKLFNIIDGCITGVYFDETCISVNTSKGLIMCPLKQNGYETGTISFVENGDHRFYVI